MRPKKLFWGLLKLTLRLLGFVVLFFSALMWNILHPLEMHQIKPGSLWGLVVDKEVRQMPTPLGAQLQGYGTKGDGLHLDGYDLALYTWANNPTDLQLWLSYWKKLGYLQLERNLNHCSGLQAQLIKADLSTNIDICHDPETKTTWIEKTH